MSIAWEEKQQAAIRRAQEERRERLDPIRRDLDDLITRVGWRRAKPIITDVLGFPPKSQRGAWWARVGIRNAKKITDRLNDLTTIVRQGELF